MERRLVIKQVLIMAAGLSLLPSCLKESGKSTILLNNLDISLDQEKLLAEIAETLIPKTDTPGAKALNLHLFVLKMLDDCYAGTDQQQFIAGLDQLEDQASRRFNKSFANLSLRQRELLLMDIETHPDKAAALSAFYRIMKEQTINGYLQSKYVMTNLIVWELVPGRYNGYFPVKSA